MFWFCSISKQPTIGSQGIVKGGRKEVFGRETIVNQQATHSSCSRQTGDQITVRLERTNDIATPMQKQHHAFCISGRWTYPFCGYAIHVNSFDAYPFRQWDWMSDIVFDQRVIVGALLL